MKLFPSSQDPGEEALEERMPPFSVRNLDVTLTWSNGQRLLTTLCSARIGNATVCPEQDASGGGEE